MIDKRATEQGRPEWRPCWRRHRRRRCRCCRAKGVAAAASTTGTRVARAARSKSRYRRPPPSRRKRGRTRRRPEYNAVAGRRLVFYSKIPCPLRVSPSPFSIAFLLLVIFSSDVWPHYVACAPPPHLRHHPYRVRTAAAAASSSSTSSSSSSSSSSSPSDGHQQKTGHRDLYSEPYHYRHPQQSPLQHQHQPQLQLQLQLQSPPPRFRHRHPHFPAVEWLPSSSSLAAANASAFLGGAPSAANSSGDDYARAALSTRARRLQRRGRSNSLTRQNRPPPPSPQFTSVGEAKRPSDAAASPWGAGGAPPAPCSHVGDETNQVAARAFAADTVFEGKVRSKSAAKDAVGKYGATFVVQRVYKDQAGGQTALRPKMQVRLFFVEKSPTSSAAKPTAHCVQRYNLAKRGADLTKANVKRGRRYLVFVNRLGPHNYTVLGEPVPHTPKYAKAVDEVVCRGCVRQIGVWGLKNKTVLVGERLKLICRIKGTPLPALQWFKDGSPIIVTSRLRIQYKKKRSSLVIPAVRNSDSGKYECRGLGVQSAVSASSSAIVSITAKLDNITALWPLAGKPCPLHAAYCLNGGSCTYYETIGEFTCQCADGFNGGRCENKDVANSNNTYEAITCYDGVTPSYPCVTVHKPLDYSL